MTLYKQWYITAMMREAMQASLTSGTKIKFVRMVASNDVIPEKDLPGLTNDSMGTIKTNQTSRISSTTNKRDIITVTSVFNNTGVTTEYRMNTIYLVAEYNGREFLAAIQVANSAYIVPVESSTEHAEYTIKAQLGLSNTTNIDLNMDPEAIATNEQLLALDKKYSDLHKEQQLILERLEQADLGNVKTSGDQQVSGSKTFMEKIIASISGHSGSTRKHSENAIEEGTDLFTLVEPGVVYSASKTVASTLKNAPTKEAFFLRVIASGDDTVALELTDSFGARWNATLNVSASETRVIKPWKNYALDVEVIDLQPYLMKPFANGSSDIKAVVIGNVMMVFGSVIATEKVNPDGKPFGGTHRVLSNLPYKLQVGNSAYQQGSSRATFMLLADETDVKNSSLAIQKYQMDGAYIAIPPRGFLGISGAFFIER